MHETLAINYCKCSAGGNITTLVFTKVERSKHTAVANAIMTQQLDVEQVGFVEESQNSDARARLQMMGGEFCGNALRALAWVLYQQGRIQEKFALEVSGTHRLLEAQIINSSVKLEMPIKRDRRSVWKTNSMTIVELEGITHVIINEPPPNDAKERARQVLDELNLMESEAAGVLYYQQCEGGAEITPIVWVSKTESLTAETACASGTVCIALANAAAQGENIEGLNIYQPSGKVITASVELNSDGSFSRAFIKGPVEILVKDTVTISLREC